jgi:hypothetical protein
MATGTVLTFEEFTLQIGQEQHNFPSDTIKMGIIDATITPAIDDATPTWSDYSANEVSTGGGYPADGITLSGVTYTEAAGVSTLDDTGNISISQDAGGFTDGYWGIIYNDTNATDMAIGFIELGGPVSEVAGPITINWNASGIMTVTRTA